MVHPVVQITSIVFEKERPGKEGRHHLMGILETSDFPGEAGGMWVNVSYAACLPSTSASPCPINEYLTS